MTTFETPRSIAAVVEVGAGHVRITASDRTDTVVEVHPTDESDHADVQAAGQTRVEYAKGQLSVIGPKKTWRSLFGRPPSVDVVIDLPGNSRVDAKVWADVHCEGRLGDATFDTAAGSIRLDETGRLKVKSGAGDIAVAHSLGPASITTASGKIRIGAVDGPATVKSANGDVTLGEVSGDVQVKTANGDITIDRALAAVEAKTAYGSIRVGEVVRGEVVLETGFGEVELGIREGTAAWLDAASKFGTVRSDLASTGDPEPSEETVQVRAHTGYGDVVVRRSSVVAEP